MYLMAVLHPALRRKSSEVIDCTPIISQDNASPHKSKIVKELLEEYGWELLDNPPPPFSSDLSPPNFDIFP